MPKVDPETGRYIKKDGTLGKRAGSPRRSSKDIEDKGITRAEKSGADHPTREGRKPRVFRGAGRALDLPDAILRDIESKDCIYRWVKDEGHRVQMFLDDWWDIYKDGNGGSIRTLAGTGKNGEGVDFILMVQKKEYAAETKRLQTEKVAGTLDSQQVLAQGAAPEYVPDGQNQVVERVAGSA